MRINRTFMLILLSALILRLMALNQSLWLDEAIEWWAVKSFGLRQLLTGYMIGDFNPPGHHLLMWFWIRIFGESEISLRLPSVLFGVGTVWFIYLIANLLKSGLGVRRGRTLARVAAGMAAVNGLMIYYSQEARMYAMAAFFVAGAMYWFLKENKTDKTNRTSRTDRTNRTNGAMYGLFLGMALYSHYLTWLLLPFLAIWGIRYLTPLLLTVPWWPMLVKQLAAGISAAENPVWAELSRTNFKNLALVAVKFVTGRVAWPDGWWGQAAAGAVVLAFWAAAAGGIREGRIEKPHPGTGLTLRRRPTASRSPRVSARSSKTFRLVILLWAGGPLILGAVIGLFIPVFTYFRFLLVLPAVLVLVAAGADKLGKEEWGDLGRWGILGILGIFSLSYLFRPEFHREDWRAAAAGLHQRDAAPVVLISPAVKPAFDYYDKAESIVVLSNQLLVTNYQLPTTVWYIPYAQPIFEPDDSTRKFLEGLGYERVFEKHFRGVTLEEWTQEGVTARKAF